MGRGLGKVQQQVLDALTAAGEPLWLRDLEQRLWGEQVSRSQRESLKRAIATLDERGLVHRGLARWNTYQDQKARHRVKVWLPNQPAPTLRQQIGEADVEHLVVEVLQEPDDRLGLTKPELQMSRIYQAPPWMSYRRFRLLLRQRVEQWTTNYRKQARPTIYRVLTRLEQQGTIQRSPRGRDRALFIRLR